MKTVITKLLKNIKSHKISRVDAAIKYLKKLHQIKNSGDPCFELFKAVNTFFYFYRINNKLFLYLKGTYTSDMRYLENIFKRINYHIPKSKYGDIEILIRSHTKKLDLDKVRQHHCYLIPCKNYIYDRKSSKVIPYNHHYFFQAKIETSYPLKAEYTKDQDTKLKQIVGNDTNITGMNQSQLNESVAQFGCNFINNISNADKDIKRQLEQEFLSCLEPYFNRGKILINLGETGSNGKSNYTQLVTDVIGKDNVSAVRLDQLSDKNALSSIQGAMAIISDDLGDQLDLKDDSNLKAITTGGSVYVDPKYQTGYTDEFHVAIVQNTNKLPKFQGKGSYISRRLLIIPFSHHFTKNDNDYIPNNTMLAILKSKPVREYFLYNILHQPIFNSFHMSKESKKLLMNFKLQNDPVKEFCNDTNLFDYHMSRFRRLEIFRDYKPYARKHNFRQLNSNEFHNRFKSIAQKHGYAAKNARFNNCGQISIIEDYMENTTGHIRNKPKLDHTYRCYVNYNYNNNSYHKGDFYKGRQTSTTNHKLDNELHNRMNQYIKTHHASKYLAAVHVYNNSNDTNQGKRFLNKYIISPIVKEKKREIYMEKHGDLPF